MKVSCQSCGAKYTILDDKVVGRKVKVRCKSCGTPIVVDGTESGGAEAGSAPVQAGTVPFAEGGDEATRVDEPPFEISEAGGDLWSVNLSDTDQRDLSIDQIVEAWKKGEITSDAFVWKEGMGDWIPILDAPDLRQRLASAAPAPRLPGAPARPTARVSPRAEANQDLFGSADSAGQDEDVSTSVAIGGKAAPMDHKPTGVRNESSVLFSLDALKAGVPAQAAAPKRATSPRAVQSSDPFDMGGPGSLASIGGGAPLFGAAAEQALLTAPAPEPPKPPPAPKAADAPAASYGAEPPKRNMKLIFGAVAGVVLLVVIGVVAMTGGSDEEQRTAKNDATAEKTETTDQGSSPTKADKPADKPAEEKKAEPATAASAAPEEKKAEAAKPADKKTEAPGQTPEKTDPAKDTKTVKPGPEVKVKETVSDGVASFNTTAAKTALATAASAVGRCRKADTSPGGGKAIVTFAPSGRVTSANVTGAFTGTPVGGCVSSVFRNAKVPAFTGSPVTVSKSFSIN